MIGQRVGSRVGGFTGSSVGSSADDEANSGPMAGVTRDATSLIYCPATLAEMATALSVAGIGSGNISALWLFQEPSGNPADASGNGFTLTATGTGFTYQAAVSGWSRKAISATDGATALLASTNAGLPSVNATSMTTIAWVLVPSASPASNRFFALEGTTASSAGIATTGVLRSNSGANATTGPSTITGANTVRPIVIKENATAVVTTGYSDQDKITPTHGAPTGQRIAFLNGGAGAFAGGVLWGCSFFSTAAELSDAQIKTLLQTLGWTIGWT